MKKHINIGIILAASIVMARSAIAQQLGFNITSPSSEGFDSAAISGYTFQVTLPVTVYGLAAFNNLAPAGIGNSLGDGGGDIKVGLWDSGGNLLASVQVPQGTLPISGTYFSEATISPITLQVGTYTIADDGYFTYVSDGPSGFSGYVTAPGLTYLSDAYNGSPSGFAFPTLSDGNSILSSSIVTTSAIPEPSTYAALFGLGALGFAAYRRRRLRR